MPEISALKSRIRKAYAKNDLTQEQIDRLNDNPFWEWKPKGYKRLTKQEVQDKISQIAPTTVIDGEWRGKSKKVDVHCKRCGLQWAPMGNTLLNHPECLICYDRFCYVPEGEIARLINLKKDFLPGRILDVRWDSVIFKCGICGKQVDVNLGDLLSFEWECDHDINPDENHHFSPMAISIKKSICRETENSFDDLHTTYYDSINQASARTGIKKNILNKCIRGHIPSNSYISKKDGSTITEEWSYSYVWDSLRSFSFRFPLNKPYLWRVNSQSCCFVS